MQHKKIIATYAIRGTLVGLFFPVFAITICVFFLYPENQTISLKNIHKTFPLMWIIDTAPFVLGIISCIIGTKVNNLNNNYLNHIESINVELMSKNFELKSLIQDKEMLLKEIHHRVKNNLQVITSLLRLQGRYTENIESKVLFTNCQYRIKSMALIHEMLYKSEDISKIKFTEYIETLILELIVSMKGIDHNINLKIHAPKIKLNLDTAIPLGLLLNEIITNSLKHGVLKDSKGIINLEISEKGNNNFNVLVGDNGVGFPDEINFKNTKTLGLKLIDRLVSQLSGSIAKVDNMNGTNYSISFQEIGELNT